MLRRCDLALANSDYTRHAILDAYPEILPARLITLHKAVDLAFFSGPRAEQDRFSPWRFVFLGSNFRIKRLHLAIEAFAALPAGSATLRVAGCTREEFSTAHSDLADAARHEGVRFLGRLGREAVRKLLLDSDTLLLPSRQEALGIAALEAIACGCRVLGARVGGIPEIIDSPEVGRLVNEPSAAAWRSAMEAEAAGAPFMGNHREVLLARFSSAHMLARLRRLYLATKPS
jgi:glycosyltransferase involved in cell wall biosynthesis